MRRMIEGDTVKLYSEYRTIILAILQVPMVHKYGHNLFWEIGGLVKDPWPASMSMPV